MLISQKVYLILVQVYLSFHWYFVWNQIFCQIFRRIQKIDKPTPLPDVKLPQVNGPWLTMYDITVRRLTGYQYSVPRRGCYALTWTQKYE